MTEALMPGHTAPEIPQGSCPQSTSQEDAHSQPQMHELLPICLENANGMDPMKTLEWVFNTVPISKHMFMLGTAVVSLILTAPLSDRLLIG